MSLVWDRFEAGGGALLLALALADFADDAGRSIWPSVQTLMRKTRQSRRTVQRQLAELRASGWLIAETSAINGDRAGLSVLYHINPDWLEGGVNLTHPPLGGVRHSYDAGGAPPVTRGVRHRYDAGGAPPVTPNPSMNRPISTNEPSEGFALSPDQRSKKPKKAGEAQRLPDDFVLTEARRTFAEQQGIDPVRTFAMFRDHWHAAAGTRAAKRDWDAVWRIWCRREPEFKRNLPGATGGRPSREQIEADKLRKLKERRDHGMNRGMQNFRDPQPGESPDNYRRAMDAEWERREPPAEPKAQEKAQQVGRLVANLAASKGMPS